MKIFFESFGLSGTLTSMIDLYNNMNEHGKNIDSYISIKSHSNMSNRQIINYIKHYGYSNFFSKSAPDIIVDDVIITSVQMFLKKYYDSLDIPHQKIKCDKLILLDSMGFIVVKENNRLEEMLEEISLACKEIIILCNKFNLNLLKDITPHNITLVEYYQKFSNTRLNILKNIKCNGKSFSSLNYLNLKKKYNNIHEFSEFEYVRHFKLGNNYIENIGKLLFEFVLLNKKSVYLNTNRTMYDGLSSYLECIGIDDTQPKIEMNNYKKQIEKLFLFDNNDFFLKDI